MDTASVDALGRRIDRLERENRRLKRGGAALLVGIALLAVAGARDDRVPKAIEAEAFVLKSQDGATLAALGITPHGAPQLAFYDANKTRRLVMVLRPDQTPVLSLNDKGGSPLASLGLREDGGSAMTLRTRGDGGRVDIAAGVRNPTGIGLSHGDSQRLAMTLRKDRTPILELRDEDGTPLAALSLRADGGSTMSFREKSKRVAVALGANADGSAGMNLLRLSGEQAQAGARMGFLPTGEATLDVIAKDGQLLFHAPPGMKTENRGDRPKTDDHRAAAAPLTRPAPGGR